MAAPIRRPQRISPVLGFVLGQVATDMTATLTHLPAETSHSTGDTPPAAQPALRVVS